MPLSLIINRPTHLSGATAALLGDPRGDSNRSNAPRLAHDDLHVSTGVQIVQQKLGNLSRFAASVHNQQ